MTVYDLPAVNASLNFLASILLTLGYRAIKRGDRASHKKIMISALCVSIVFFGCYLVYHYYAGSKKFPVSEEYPWARWIYLFILFSHIALSIIMLPFIFKTFYHAFRDELERHKKIATATFFMWKYVSVTGVLIYLLLYQLAPSII